MLNAVLKHIPENNRFERIWKLAQVDFKKRYYNDKLGLIWALINPLSQIAIYYFVFTVVLEKDEENFVPFLFSGLIMWIAFSEATKTGANILTNKKYLIENIQFNWIDLYLSHMTSIFMGLIFNLVAYFGTVIILGVSVGSHFLMFPLILLNWFILTTAVVIILSLLNPIFEDIKHIWAIVILVGFWVSGIFFAGSFYLTEYEWMIHLNPFVGILLNTRACLLEGNEFYLPLFIENMIASIGLFILSIFLLKKYSKKVAEFI